jgi:hypothetical protein
MESTFIRWTHSKNYRISRVGTFCHVPAETLIDRFNALAARGQQVPVAAALVQLLCPRHSGYAEGLLEYEIGGEAVAPRS